MDNPVQEPGSAGVPPVSQEPAPGSPDATSPPPALQETPAQGLKQVNIDDRLKELENFLSERDKEIGELKASLEKAGMEASSQVAAHQAAITKSEDAIKVKDAALATVLTAYRTAILQVHPDIPEEMVTGSTMEELQGNLDKAKVLVQKIREKAPQTTTVPAGAPARTGPDLSAMSSREKIVHGLKK